MKTLTIPAPLQSTIRSAFEASHHQHNLTPDMERRFVLVAIEKFCEAVARVDVARLTAETRNGRHFPSMFPVDVACDLRPEMERTELQVRFKREHSWGLPLRKA